MGFLSAIKNAVKAVVDTVEQVSDAYTARSIVIAAVAKLLKDVEPLRSSPDKYTKEKSNIIHTFFILVQDLATTLDKSKVPERKQAIYNYIAKEFHSSNPENDAGIFMKHLLLVCAHNEHSLQLANIVKEALESLKKIEACELPKEAKDFLANITAVLTDLELVTNIYLQDNEEKKIEPEESNRPSRSNTPNSTATTVIDTPRDEPDSPVTPITPLSSDEEEEEDEEKEIEEKVNSMLEQPAYIIELAATHKEYISAAEQLEYKVKHMQETLDEQLAALSKLIDETKTEAEELIEKTKPLYDFIDNLENTKAKNKEESQRLQNLYQERISDLLNSQLQYLNTASDEAEYSKVFSQLAGLQNDLAANTTAATNLEVLQRNRKAAMHVLEESKAAIAMLEDHSKARNDDLQVLDQQAIKYNQTIANYTTVYNTNNIIHVGVTQLKEMRQAIKATVKNKIDPLIEKKQQAESLERALKDELLKNALAKVGKRAAPVEEYLSKRNKTYSIRDFFSQVAAFFLSCFGYETKKAQRTQYIQHLLLPQLKQYSTTGKGVEELKQTIQAGLSGPDKFTPRASKYKEGYKDSLHYQLKQIQNELTDVDALMQPEVEVVAAPVVVQGPRS